MLNIGLLQCIRVFLFINAENVNNKNKSLKLSFN